MLTWIVQLKTSCFEFAMVFATSRRFAHLPSCLLGSLDSQEHNHEGLATFESNLANNQRERSLAPLGLANRKARSHQQPFLSPRYEVGLFEELIMFMLKLL